MDLNKSIYELGAFKMTQVNKRPSSAEPEVQLRHSSIELVTPKSNELIEKINQFQIENKQVFKQMFQNNKTQLKLDN